MDLDLAENRGQLVSQFKTGSDSSHAACAELHRQAVCQSAIVDAMQTHVSMKHLLGVASADNQIFTLEEFNHLKECTECFEAWSDSIDQLVRDGTLISNSASKSSIS